MSESHKVNNVVSVIVPVYRVEPYIQECVCSIINQTYPDIEVVLVDDAGGDRSIDLAKEVLLKCNRVWKVIKHERNLGVSAARNNAIAAAKGTYLFLIDSDDYLEPFCIEKFVEVALRYDAEMVFANHWDIVNGQVVPSCRLSASDVYSDNPVSAHINGKTTSMAGNRMIRRDFYLKSKVCFREGLRYEDELWSFSLILRAKRIAFLDACTYYYRRWEGAFTGNRDNELYRIKCSYQNLLHHYAESEKFNLFSNTQFNVWLAKKTFNFLNNVARSNLDASKKRDYFNSVFKDIKLPQPEFDKYTLYVFRVFRKLPLDNRFYFGVKLLSLLRRVKNIIRKK